MAVLCTSLSLADSIVISGQHYDGVYVMEGENSLYICFPNDGHVVTAAKTDPSVGELHRTADAAERAAIHAAYKEHHASVTGADVSAKPNRAKINLSYKTTTNPAAETPETPTLRLKGDTNVIRSEIIALFNQGQGQTEDQPLSGAGSGRTIQTRDGGFGGAGQTLGGGVGGVGGGGGAAGGGGVAGVGGGGAAGGGGGTGGANGGAGFSNISQLFGTISDRAVGEQPNPITGG